MEVRKSLLNSIAENLSNIYTFIAHFKLHEQVNLLYDKRGE